MLQQLLVKISCGVGILPALDNQIITLDNQIITLDNQIIAYEHH